MYTFSFYFFRHAACRFGLTNHALCYWGLTEVTTDTTDCKSARTGWLVVEGEWWPTADTTDQCRPLRARCTTVDQTWTKFKLELDLGSAVKLCCTNAVQINSRVELGLTLNRPWRQIAASCSEPYTVIPAMWVQIGDKLGSSAGIASSFRSYIKRVVTLMHDCAISEVYTITVHDN